MTRLTKLAHERIASILKPGETAIDATAGNGQDTCFLCSTVGPAGRVFALDIQQTALEQTADRLAQQGCFQCELICCDHGLLQEVIPEQQHNQVGAIMFNLGYLPGGDHALITQPASTLAAVKAAVNFLRPGGIMTIVAYPGHPGGAEEANAINHWMNQLAETDFHSEVVLARSQAETAPRLMMISKLES